MVTVLEILSNEVLMELFEYLDAYHLFQGFFNLNIRLNRLLTDHRLNLKFHSKNLCNNTNDILSPIMVNYLNAVTLINDRHIQMFMSVMKDNDLIYLQSLTLHHARMDRGEKTKKFKTDESQFTKNSSVVKCILKLKSLVNLHIQSTGSIEELIMMIIGYNTLPNLKSFECLNSEYLTTLLFTWPEQTNIEHLKVQCLLQGLDCLLQQTPKLKYLDIDLTNCEPDGTVLSTASFPKMMNLTQLTMKMHILSYIQLSTLIESMPYLKSLEISGSTLGTNFDNGHQLKQLLGYIQEVIIEDLECQTSASSTNAIVSTFNNESDGFWSDVTCSIENGTASISAFGYRKSLC